MAKIEFPKQLKDLLEDSELAAPIRALADQVGTILHLNQMPFFPAYTDHGVEHVNKVLKWEVELVPAEVWANGANKSLLNAADAAILVGGTLLHDLAMYLQPTSFLALIGENTRYTPLPWFRENQEGHSADLPWPRLWDDYNREAKRYSDAKLEAIVGPTVFRSDWKFEGLPVETYLWNYNHRLIIGEFIRRHHARLAHEIAIYGFPGLHPGARADEFPALGQLGHPLREFADLIGLTARSHGISLRVCQEYLKKDSRHVGSLRPMGSVVLYPMALLRVADYFQIDADRAPPVLLQLRDPQSPISLREWEKHRAVVSITDADPDPRAKMIKVSSDVSLEIYLQLQDLITGLQSELDHSTVVLDEAYGLRPDLSKLGLSIRRVNSNLSDSNFMESLDFVPRRISFSTDANLLSLLVEPLYGPNPSIGVRELMQNALDAVRELHAWCRKRCVEPSALHLPDQEQDVLIEYVRRDDGGWLLRIQDKGIGMTADTVAEYFLRAGASFRKSIAWMMEFHDDFGKPMVVRSGRFGIGAFTVFLLGRSFRVWTCHVSDDQAGSYFFAAEDSRLVEVRRVPGLPIGTRIEVEFSESTAQALGLFIVDGGVDFGESVDWYCREWPQVHQRVVVGSAQTEVNREFNLSFSPDSPKSPWAMIKPKGFDAVFWTFGDWPVLTCNGLRLAKPGVPFQGSVFAWPPQSSRLRRPCIEVLDSDGNLPLSLRRDELADGAIPFLEDLARDVHFSFVAYCLVCGPISREQALGGCVQHPLAPQGTLLQDDESLDYLVESRSLIWDGPIRWCATDSEFVPGDPWLIRLLSVKKYIIYGAISSIENASSRFKLWDSRAMISIVKAASCASIYWNLLVSGLAAEYRVLLEIVKNGGSFFGSHEPPRRIRIVAYCFARGSWFEDESLWRKSAKADDRLRGRKLQGALAPHLFDLGKETLQQTAELVPLLENFTASLVGGSERFPVRTSESKIPVLFVAEIEPMKGTLPKQSRLAEIWEECLGSISIPFDPTARRKLIGRARLHPELRRHIEIWDEMARNGSKWFR